MSKGLVFLAFNDKGLMVTHHQVEKFYNAKSKFEKVRPLYISKKSCEFTLDYLFNGLLNILLTISTQKYEI
jgi:hypothetical protein